MEHKIKLKDPDHPEAEKVAEATARLLIEVRENRSQQANNSDKTAFRE